MIMAWMCAAVLFTACVTAAGHGVARIARSVGRPTRTVWTTVLAVAVVWPLIVPVMRPVLRNSAQTVATVEMMAPIVMPLAPMEPVARGLTDRLFDLVAPYGSVLLALWLCASLLLLARLLLAARHLHTLTRGAVHADVDGEPVLLSQSLGPASVGWRSPRIVLPPWVLKLDAPLRAMVLQHEREHCRRGDPRVVWYATLATALVPWNPGVWWIARQLRLALELDCDARTLAYGGDAHLYAKLLLFMTQQHAAPAVHVRLASSLAGPGSHLRQRIIAMQHTHRTSSQSARVALGALSVAALFAACTTRIPGNVDLGDREETASVQQPTVAVEPYFEFQVEKPASMLPGSNTMVYPPMLRSAQVEGSVLASFVLRADGTADMSTFKVLRSDHELFTNAVRIAIPEVKYTPAEIGGRRVAQVIQQPFVFSLDGKRPAGAAQLDDQPTPGTPYFEFQVDNPAEMMGSSAVLRYPAMLRAANVEGTVLAQFVVTPNGRVDQSTIKFLRSDHPEFSESVREALRAAVYVGAEKDGRRVAQVVQQPFLFSIGGKSLAGASANASAIVAGSGGLGRLSAPAAKLDDQPTPGTPYFEFQVEKPASMVPGTRTMQYPELLRSAEVEGTVLASFVVGTDGVPDLSTFKVLRSDHELFTNAVKTSLPTARYTPAEVGGRKVKQLVQQPFVFSLAR